MPRPLFTPGKDPVPNVQEARWFPGPVWMGAENLADTGIRSADRPVRGQSLPAPRRPVNIDNISLSSSWVEKFFRQKTLFKVSKIFFPRKSVRL